MKKKNGDELFTAKAYNGRVILSWLSHTLLLALQQHPDHEILLLTSSAMKLGCVIHCLQIQLLALRSLFGEIRLA